MTAATVTEVADVGVVKVGVVNVGVGVGVGAVVAAGLGGFLWPFTGLTGRRTVPSGGGLDLEQDIVFIG